MEFINNLVRNNNCPVECEHYSNNTGEDGESFCEHCDLGKEYEMVKDCPIGIWTTK